MADMNPQLREMMQNPELMRQMMNPETMQVSCFGESFVLARLFTLCFMLTRSHVLHLFQMWSHSHMQNIRHISSSFNIVVETWPLIKLRGFNFASNFWHLCFTLCSKSLVYSNLFFLRWIDSRQPRKFRRLLWVFLMVGFWNACFCYFTL